MNNKNTSSLEERDQQHRTKDIGLTIQCRNVHQQITDSNIDSDLRKQRRCPSAIIGLRVEKVEQQVTKQLSILFATHGFVGHWRRDKVI